MESSSAAEVSHTSAIQRLMNMKPLPEVELAALQRHIDYLETFALSVEHHEHHDEKQDDEKERKK